MADHLKKQTIVAVSGGFDPLHIGHIRLIKGAKKLGDKLVVILNNDNWIRKKKGHVFMSQQERKTITELIKGVDRVVLTNHGPNPKDMSVSKELLKLKPDIFANGGNSTLANVPEVATCRSIGCKMVYGVGKGGKIQSSSLLLTKYVKSIKARKHINTKKALKEMEKVFLNSSVSLPNKLKLKLGQLTLSLVNSRDGFGLFMIFGWQSKWNKFTDIPDRRQDIYANHHVNILEVNGSRSRIGSTINFDGAILINKKGEVLHSGIMIEGLRPKEVANKVNPGKFKDLSEQFGFKEKVHLRHLSAITASYIFKNTTIFTVSEESDTLHIFEKGKIIYSTT